MSNSLQTLQVKTATASNEQVFTVRILVPTIHLPLVERSVSFSKAYALAGGYTMRCVHGAWLDANGDEVKEDIREYEFIVNPDLVQAVTEYLAVLSSELLAAGEQAVLMTTHTACVSTLFIKS